MDQIYTNVINLLNKHDIKAKDLEIQLNFKHGTIKNMKRHQPKIKTLDKIASYFNLTIEDLLKHEKFEVVNVTNSTSKKGNIIKIKRNIYNKIVEESYYTPDTIIKIEKEFVFLSKDNTTIKTRITNLNKI